MNRRVQPPAPLPPATARPRASAARHAEPAFGWRHWLSHHRSAAVDAGRRLLARPLAAAMTLSLGGLALALPLLLWCLSANLQQLVSGLRRSGEIAVFLAPGLDAQRAARSAASVRAMPDVAAVEIRTPADGLQELRGIEGFGEAIQAIDGNPLPYVLLVQAADPEQADPVAEALAARPDVDQVQHDRQWRQRLDHLLALLQRLAASSLALFGLAALLVIGNSVRMDVAARSEELGIVKLLGASDAFVRRPFLWGGFWLGLLSALLALALSFGARAYFAAPVRTLAGSYASTFTLQGPDAVLCLATLACGVLLGCIGALLASTVQLVSDRAS